LGDYNEWANAPKYGGITGMEAIVQEIKQEI
jgi:hypothetical protein